MYWITLTVKEWGGHSSSPPHWEIFFQWDEQTHIWVCSEISEFSGAEISASEGWKIWAEQNGVINLTPHNLDIHTPEGVVHIPPSGKVARVSETREEMMPVKGIPVSRPAYGGVENLPEPRPGTIYIVSALVLARCARRRDVFAPGKARRDAAGRIVGCDGLSASPMVP